jgi:glycosyltransferase involved in cell wall biosynthesis
MRVFIVPPNDLLRHPLPNRVYHIAKRLADKYEIYLLSYTGHPLAKEKKRELKAIEIPVNNAIRVGNLGLYYIINTPQIHEAIKSVIDKYGIDIVLHGNILPSFIASRLSKKYRIPSVYDFLDYYPQSASAYYSRGKWIVERYVWMTIHKAILNSNAVVTPSHSLRKVVEGIAGNTQVHVIPNGVDAKVFRPVDQKIARRSIGLSSEHHVALLAGSLDAWLDVEGVFKAISELIRRGFDLRLVIVGYPHSSFYLYYMSKLAKHYGIYNHLYIYPSQPYEKMPLFINSSDFVLAPYKKMIKNYTTPVKFAESLACGVPIVTTNIPEFRFWYGQGIFQYDTSGELVEVIKGLLSRVDEVKSILRERRLRYIELFDWDNIANKYSKIIESLHRK